MKEGKEFYNIIEEIINSYELKVRTVTSLIRQVIQKIKIFHRGFERVKVEIGSQWHKVIATVNKSGVTALHLGRTIERGIKN